VFTFSLAVIYLKVSPDVAPVLETLKKRLGFGRNRL
jgi:hypothetical protein